MYNKFSQDYDRFVNWHNRLAFELPFLLKQLGSVTPQPGDAPPRAGCRLRHRAARHRPG